MIRLDPQVYLDAMKMLADKIVPDIARACERPQELFCCIAISRSESLEPRSEGPHRKAFEFYFRPKDIAPDDEAAYGFFGRTEVADHFNDRQTALCLMAAMVEQERLQWPLNPEEDDDATA